MFFDHIFDQYYSSDSPGLWEKLWYSFKGAVVYALLSLPTANNMARGIVFTMLGNSRSSAALMYGALALKSAAYMVIVFLMMIF